MVLSKKAKNKKNKTHNVISLNESIKESNPFEYLQKIDKKSLNKFIIKALKGKNIYIYVIMIKYLLYL